MVKTNWQSTDLKFESKSNGWPDGIVKDLDVHKHPRLVHQAYEDYDRRVYLSGISSEASYMLLIERSEAAKQGRKKNSIISVSILYDKGEGHQAVVERILSNAQMLGLERILDDKK